MKKISIFFFLFAVISLTAQEFPIAEATYSQTYPEISYTNDNYLVAFLDKRSGGSIYEFWARFVDTEGIIDAVEHQLVPPHSALSFMHHLCHGNENYLFGWSRQRSAGNWTRDAYGRLVGDDGEPLGNSFAISLGNTESASFIRIAYDGENYLVVWQEGMPASGAMIKGQLVDGSGSLIGSNFLIRPQEMVASVAQIYPDVAFNGNEFLVVWDDDRTGNRDIYGWFVDCGGSLIGEDFPICQQATDQLLVRLAYHDNRYLAVWADERNSSNDNSIYGQLLDAAGNLLGDNLAISITQNSEGRSWSDIGVSNNEFLVTWKQEFLVYRDEAADVDFLHRIQYEAAGIETGRPTVWYDVYGRKIGFDGSPLSDEFPICTAVYHQDEQAVASNGADFLVAWEDSRNANSYYDIYGSIIAGTEMPDGFLEGIVILNGDYGSPDNLIIQIGDIQTITDVAGYFFCTLPPGEHSVSTGSEWYQQFTDTVTIVSGETTFLLITLEPIDYEPLIFTPDSLQFLDWDDVGNGVELSIQNVADFAVTLNELSFFYHCEFPNYDYWPDPYPSLPHEMQPDEILNFTLYLALPVELISRETVYDSLLFVTEYPVYSLPILLNTELINNSADDQSLALTPLPELNFAPNPFNPTTHIFYVIPAGQKGWLSFYNSRGQLLESILLSDPKGDYVWNARDLPSGIYICRLRSGDQAVNRKLILLR